MKQISLLKKISMWGAPLYIMVLFRSFLGRRETWKCIAVLEQPLVGHSLRFTCAIFAVQADCGQGVACVRFQHVGGEERGACARISVGSDALLQYAFVL